MRTLDQVILFIRNCQVRRNTGEGVFVGDAFILDELMDYLKELKGLSTYQAQLGSELAQMTSRHRKFNRAVSSACDVVEPIEIEKLPSATESYIKLTNIT